MNKRFNITILFFLAALFASLLSCKKESKNPDSETESGFEEYAGTEVYVAGDFKTDSPVLWKNGIPKYILDNGKLGMANHIIGYGNDIYIAGMTQEFTDANPSNFRSAMYWKNEEKILVDKSNDTELEQIHRAESGDIYLYGYSYGVDPTWDSIWKNGKPYKLEPVGSRWGMGNMLTIGNDFYMAGSALANNKWNGIVWKNGKLFKRFSYNSSVDIATNGTDLFYYVYATEDPQTKKKSFKVYKNSSLFYSINFADNEWSFAGNRKIFHEGNNSYVAWITSTNNNTELNNVKVWKNGKQMNINIRNVYTATALFVKGNDVYLATLKEDPDFDLKPELYKNNKLMPMDYENNNRARFNSIYVK